MIIDVMNNNDIFLSWRENGEKKIDIKSFRPYFYVEDSHKEIASYNVSKYLKRDFEYESGEWFSLEGTKLSMY